MSKKKGRLLKEIGVANMLRFYDSGLLERLNKRFQSSGNSYDNRNHFLTDLIEAGLNRREQEISFKDKLLLNETETYKSIDAFAERFMEFEKYVRTQFQSVHASDYLIKAVLSNICYLSEATNFGTKLPRDNVLNGIYNELPERFIKLKETAEGVFIKNE